MIVARTSRLTLRQLRESDADALGRVLGDAGVMRYGEGALSPGEVRQRIREYVERWCQEWGRGMWAVVE